MSLINDALKRANEQKSKQVSAQELGATLQTADSADRDTKVWPIAVSVMMLFGSAWLGWSWWRGDRITSGEAPIPVAAREAQSAATAAIVSEPASDAISSPSVSAASAPAAALPVETPAPALPPTAAPVFSSPAPAPVVAARTLPSVPPPAAPSPEVASVRPPTPSAPAVASPAVATAEPAALTSFPKLVLQGIYFRPSHPAAVINAKTLYVGDRVSQAKVLAIDRRQVTVQWNNEVRVLAIE